MRAHRASAPLGLHSFERRELRDHDVMIDIHYCGICHTDIHQVRNEWGASTFPMVPGHEIAGVVTGIGAKVTRHKMGDRVAIGSLYSFIANYSVKHSCLSTVLLNEVSGFPASRFDRIRRIISVLTTPIELQERTEIAHDNINTRLLFNAIDVNEVNMLIDVKHVNDAKII